jgi:hypothetical protein
MLLAREDDGCPVPQVDGWVLGGAFMAHGWTCAACGQRWVWRRVGRVWRWWPSSDEIPDEQMAGGRAG